MNKFIRSVVTLLDQLFPLPRGIITELTTRHRIKSMADAVLGEDDRVYLALDLAEIKEAHKAALGLREQLQRRAQGYLMAVTVASSFTLSMLALLAKVRPGIPNPVPLATPTRIMLLAILASFLMSAVSALRVLGPSEVYDVWLRALVPSDPEQRKVNLIRFIQLNEAYAMAYACHVQSSYLAMRNGVVLLPAISRCVMAWSSFLSGFS